MLCFMYFRKSSLDGSHRSWGQPLALLGTDPKNPGFAGSRACPHDLQGLSPIICSKSARVCPQYVPNSMP